MKQSLNLIHEKKSRGQYLAQNITVFTVGNIGSKLVVFLLVPLYTAIFKAEEYGTVDLISTLITIAVPIFTVNICESVMRFALDKDANYDAITRIGVIVLAVGSVVALLIIPICSLFELTSSYSTLSYFFVISSAASQLFLCDLRGKEKLKWYAAGSILNTLLVAAFSILFLVVFRKGIAGYLWSHIIANLSTAFYAIIVGEAYRSFVPKVLNRVLLKNMLKYAAVMIPNSFLWWIMNSSDRIMITGMISPAANGVYSVSYKLPTLVTVLASIFNQAWSYSAISEKGSSGEAEYNNEIFRLLTSIVMTTGIIIIGISKPFMKLYVGESYYSAWRYIPFLTIGFVYLTLGTFMATSYSVHKDGYGYLFSGLFGALLNVMLNAALIPIIDVYGAAVATGASYIAVFVFRLFHTRKYIKFNIRNREFFCGTLALAVISCSLFVEGIMGSVVQILVVCSIVSFYSTIWGQTIKALLEGRQESIDE